MLKKISVAAAIAVLGFSGANANEISFFGGLQDTKNIGNNNESKNVGSYELNFKAIPEENGFASNVKLKYQDNDGISFYDLEGLFGWQLGDKSGWGAVRILPLGIGYRYIDFEKMYGIYGTYDSSDSVYSFYYKAGVEYVKDKFLVDALSLNVGAYYQTAFYTQTWETTQGNYYQLEYEPSGYEFELGLDYNFTDNFAVGVKAGYSKIEDKFFVNGTKLYINDGFNASLGVKYKF